MKLAYIFGWRLSWRLGKQLTYRFSGAAKTPAARKARSARVAYLGKTHCAGQLCEKEEGKEEEREKELGIRRREFLFSFSRSVQNLAGLSVLLPFLKSEQGRHDLFCCVTNKILYLCYKITPEIFCFPFREPDSYQTLFTA